MLTPAFSHWLSYFSEPKLRRIRTSDPRV